MITTIATACLAAIVGFIAGSTFGACWVIFHGFSMDDDE